MSNPDPPAGPMTVRSAMLADFAKIEQSGLLSIVGGGVSHLTPTALPQPLTLYVVVQLTKDRQRRVQTVVTCDVVRPTGEVAMTIGGELDAPLPDDVINIVIGLNFIVDTEGSWRIGVTFGDDQPSIDLPLRVQVRPPA